MTVALISRFGRERADFAKALADLEEPAFLFTLNGVVPEYEGTNIQVYGFESMTDGRIDLLIADLHRENYIRSLIVLEEGEVLRAARIRERLQIPGQWVRSALAFRDKPTMKEAALKGGIPVAPFTCVEMPVDIRDFADQYGYPIVVKPRSGMSSTDTFVLHNMAELNAWLGSHVCSDMMVEKYIEGGMYHVDGIVVNRKIEFHVGCRICEHMFSLSGT